MLSFKVSSKDIKDTLLVAPYEIVKVINKSNLTIGDIADQITNGMDLRTYKDKGLLYIRGIDEKREQIDTLTPKRVDYRWEDVPNKIKLEPGDILVTRKGTPGITSIYTKELGNIIIGTEIIKIRLKKDSNISPEYLSIFLNSKLGISQIQVNLTGTVARGINHRALRGIKVIVPNYDQKEQIDSLIKEANKKHFESLNLIEMAKNKLMGILGSPVSTNIKTYTVTSHMIYLNLLMPVFYYPGYIKPIEDLKTKFNMLKLGNISNIQKGNEVGSINYRSYREKLDDDIPFVRTSDLPNYEVEDYPDYYIGNEIFDDLKQDLLPNDILFSNDGKIGISAMFTAVDRCIIQSHIRRIRILETLPPEYVFIFLNTIYGKYQIKRRILIQSTIPTIGNGLKDIQIPEISSEDQNEIVNLVKRAYKLKEEKKKLIRRAKYLIEHIIAEI